MILFQDLSSLQKISENILCTKAINIYLKFWQAGSSVNIELNPELEFVVTVDERPLSVEDGVEHDADFWNTKI